ncbi:MAG TPA: DUF6455 family protein [Roseovarius sp.]
MLDYFKTFRDRMWSSREIDSLDERLLEDIGISRFGLRNLSSTSKLVMRRLMAMSTRQNVDESALLGDLQNLSVVVERCKNCRKTRACAKYLAAQSVSPDEATFCRNLAEFRRLSLKSPGETGVLR